MKINEEKLRKVIRAAVAHQMLVKENTMITSHLAAARELEIEAKKTVLNFESKVIAALSLVDPEQMDPTSQKVYVDAATKLQEDFSNLVIAFIGQVSKLPSSKDATPESTTKVNVTPSSPV
jgi:chorismate synthase